MNDNPFATEWNNDAAEYEHELARTTCPNCNGTGAVPDIFGDYEPCDECAFDEDAIAETLIEHPELKIVGGVTPTRLSEVTTETNGPF